MSSVFDLDNFIAWALEFSTSKMGECLRAQITISSPAANPSARLDVCSSTALGRITCWDDGSYHAEILGLNTEKKSALENLALSRMASF